MAGGYLSWIYLAAMVLLFYFVLIRPQRKQAKERTSMLSKLKKGDRVITIGGLHGTVTDLNDERVTLKVNDTNRLVFERGSINTIVNQEEEKVEEKPETIEEVEAEEVK